MKKSLAKQFKEGFSLVELLVSIAIIGILVSVVTYNQSQFSKTILLDNLGHEIALLIKSEQSKAINVQVGNSVNSQIDYGHGMQIVFDNINTTKKASISFFDDIPNAAGAIDGRITTSAEVNSVDSGRTVSLSNNQHRLTNICYKESSEPFECVIKSGKTMSSFNFSWSFKRPYSRPYIYIIDNSVNLANNPQSNNLALDWIAIEVKDTELASARYIKLYSTGQITVEKTL